MFYKKSTNHDNNSIRTENPKSYLFKSLSGIKTYARKTPTSISAAIQKPSDWAKTFLKRVMWDTKMGKCIYHFGLGALICGIFLGVALIAMATRVHFKTAHKNYEVKIPEHTNPSFWNFGSVWEPEESHWRKAKPQLVTKAQSTSFTKASPEEFGTKIATWTIKATDRLK